MKYLILSFFLLACNGSEIRKLREENRKLQIRNKLLDKANDRFKKVNKELKEQVEKQFFTTPEGARAKLKSDEFKETYEKRYIERSWCDMRHPNNNYSGSIEVLPFELRSQREVLIKRCDGSNCVICNLTIKE